MVVSKKISIGILSRNQDLYSTQRIVEAAEQRGHTVRVIDPLKCHIDINAAKPMVRYVGGEELIFDAIIPRIGASITFFGTAVLRQFEMAGTYVLNSSLAISRARDKLRAHQILSRKAIDMPHTGFAASQTSADELIDVIGGAPLVIKLLEGTQGKGVVLCETKQAAENIIHAFRNLNAFFLVQEFIAEAKGKDMRCFVIGDKVVAAMQRSAMPGEFRSNVHLGASTAPARLDRLTKQIAVRATKALGLQVSGVDIVVAKRGPLVLEVNSSPGLCGIEGATGKDIANMMIRHIEKAHNKHSITKNQQA